MSLSQRLSSFFAARPVRVWPARARGRRRAVPSHLLQIPIAGPSAEERECDRWRDLGRKLAEQDDWDGLLAVMRKTDEARALTPGGHGVAGLLSRAARATAMEGDKLAASIETHDARLDDRGQDHALAALLAEAHMDAAQAPNLDCGDADKRADDAAKADAHMTRAAECLDPIAATHSASMLVVAARCRLAAAKPVDVRTLVALHRDLIDLAPMASHHLRAFGRRLLSHPQGTGEVLHTEARHVAERLSDSRGAGGYTWMMLDAVTADPGVLPWLDAQLFVDGLHDILARHPDQSVVNLLAAFCAVTMDKRSGLPASDHTRRRLNRCLGPVVRNHLTELHPMIWDRARSATVPGQRNPTPADPFGRGRRIARRAVASVFRTELALGQTVTFTANGPVVGAC